VIILNHFASKVVFEVSDQNAADQFFRKFRLKKKCRSICVIQIVRSVWSSQGNELVISPSGIR